MVKGPKENVDVEDNSERVVGNFVSAFARCSHIGAHVRGVTKGAMTTHQRFLRVY